MAERLAQPDYAALVAAIDDTCGPCECGKPLTRRLGIRCRTCCQKDALFLELLAAMDEDKRPTLTRWSIWRQHPILLRMLEPVQ